MNYNFGETSAWEVSRFRFSSWRWLCQSRDGLPCWAVTKNSAPSWLIQSKFRLPDLRPKCRTFDHRRNRRIKCLRNWYHYEIVRESIEIPSRNVQLDLRRNRRSVKLHNQIWLAESSDLPFKINSQLSMLIVTLRFSILKSQICFSLLSFYSSHSSIMI